MDVPLDLPISNKNRTKMSYDDVFIQKIARTTTTRRPPPPTDDTYYKFFLQSFNENLRNLLNRSSIANSQRSRENLDFWMNYHSRSKPEDVSPWRVPQFPVLNRTELFDFSLPPMKVPKIKFVDTRPTSPIWIASSTVLFCIFLVLRICIYCQRCEKADYSQQRRLSLEQQLEAGRHTDTEQGDNESETQSITSDESSSIQADLPPSYSECAPNSYGIDNKTLDLDSEQLPPPYSSYLEMINNKDEATVHKNSIVDNESQSQVINSANTILTDIIFLRINDSHRIGDTVINIDENITHQSRTTGENKST